MSTRLHRQCSFCRFLFHVWRSSRKSFPFAVVVAAFVAAFALHEFAHAWAAVRLGDDTPRRMGRLTLDPIAHLDPFGSLMFLITQLTGYGIGWAKPVPFLPRNLGNPRRDTMLVAIAGPISNLLQVPFWLAGLWLLSYFSRNSDPAFAQNVIYGLGGQSGGATTVTQMLGIILAFGCLSTSVGAFNMFPIPPLDGHYILEGLGPPFIADFFNTIRPFSFILLLVLAQTGLIGQAIGPFLQFGLRLIVGTLASSLQL
jgi:Zn-dependent protease